MLQDKNFPITNNGVLLVVALDIMDEMWEQVKGQKSEDRFIKFHDEMMKRIHRLQKTGFLDPKLRKLRSLEEIKNATR